MVTLPKDTQPGRLDQALVECGLATTRSRARDAILRGTVFLDGAVASKPAQTVAPGCEILLDDPASVYVSRAALKLVAGLNHFHIDPEGCVALDIGASTGGFTQVLLERGAAQIYAIDVGHGQLNPAIASDNRVTSIERLNARDLAAVTVANTAPDLLVCDVSFISLKLALPPALNLAGVGASGVFLVKPQFEAGRDAIGKGGILRDRQVGSQIADGLSRWLDNFDGWRSLGVCASPIIGGDGNQEFLLGGIKDR